MTSTKIILASQSPQRARLLRDAGVAVEVLAPSYVEPEPPKTVTRPAAFAEMLSMGKAESVAAEHPDRVVLAADTIVAIGDRIIGKAADVADARRILKSLFDTVHQVITAVTVLHVAAGYCRTGHAVSTCRMRAMSEQELADYLAGGQWQGKAGAYGIQDAGDPFVTLVSGSFDNVVGLPVSLVREILADAVRA